jgi:hypothetical protein
MAKTRLGTVDSISGFVSGDGQRIIHIDGKGYAVSVNLERFPIKPGSIVEYSTRGNCADILAVQAELLPVPMVANLFNGGAQ